MIPTEIVEAETRAIDVERRRCVRLTLNAQVIAELSGEDTVARILDRLATAMEHPDLEEMARES